MAAKTYSVSAPEGIAVARSFLGPDVADDATEVELEFENEGQERAVLAAGWLEEVEEKKKGKSG